MPAPVKQPAVTAYDVRNRALEQALNVLRHTSTAYDSDRVVEEAKKLENYLLGKEEAVAE